MYKFHKNWDLKNGIKLMARSNFFFGEVRKRMEFNFKAKSSRLGIEELIGGCRNALKLRVLQN